MLYQELFFSVKYVSGIISETALLAKYAHTLKEFVLVFVLLQCTYTSQDIQNDIFI